YLIFRIFAETGMRKGELINIDYDNIDLEKRYLKTKGKTAKKVYYISKDLAKFLEIYLKERSLKNVNSKALFLSPHLKRYAERQFNIYLKKVLADLGIKKDITCHSFRRTLNTLRKVMACPNEDRKILINHKVKDVNVESYVKLNYNQFIDLYDKWNPYQDIQI
ncbi:MAG: tyrosine-type recombinase/integrase, partial [Candidatus Odinarchaeota archaeon]